MRILLADDHQLLLDGVKALLEKEADLEVVGTARDGRQAVEQARRLKPDVVVMEAAMPRMNGVEATRRLCAKPNGLRVLCLSMHAERRYLTAMLGAGASGYVLKADSSRRLIEGIRRIAAGSLYLCPRMAALAVTDYRDALTERRAQIAEVHLTDREREVLQLIAEGYTSQGIASRLGVSQRTITTHRKNIADKLDIHSIAGLTKYAIRHNLTTPADHR